ncbi:hypothetical protein FACS189494_11090 [Spirochaetia bacterium]|nr:hypothetical protein FACS189494_11090 [Spirochaetia bacterium]
MINIDEKLANILLSGLLASVLSVIITSITNYFYQKKSEKQHLSDTLMQLNTFLISEPFLESDTALKKYLKGTNDIEDMIKNDKYNAYCIVKYNYLSDICKYYKYNLEKINKELALKEYLQDNKEWWENNRRINYSSYDKEFLHLIEGVVNEA